MLVRQCGEKTLSACKRACERVSQKYILSLHNNFIKLYNQLRRHCTICNNVVVCAYVLARVSLKQFISQKY